MPYVEVYVDADYALKSLDDEALEEELERRKAKKACKLAVPPEMVSIEVESLRSVSDELVRGRVDEALVILERLLPSDFRHLSLHVAKFFGAHH